MLDPPGIERRVEHLLIEVPVDLHIGLAIDPILAQRIGPDVWLKQRITSIRHKVRIPQPGLTPGQDDLREMVDPLRQATVCHLAERITAAAHGRGQRHVDGHCLQARPGTVNIASCPGFDAVIDLRAHLQRHDRHHHLACAGDKKRGHIHCIHPQAQPVIQTLLQQLAVGIGGWHRELARIGFQPFQVQAVQPVKQLAGGRIQVDLAKLEVDFIHIDRRLNPLGVSRALVQLVVEPREKCLGLALGHQVGKQPLILRCAQVQAQLILEGFQGRVLLEWRHRITGDIDHQGFHIGFFHHRHLEPKAAVLPLGHR